MTLKPEGFTEEYALNFPRETMPQEPDAPAKGILLRWVQSILEARKFDPGPSYEPDYGDRLRREEGYRPEGFRIERYNENGTGKETAWQKWILGVVGLCLVGMLSWALGKLDTLNQEVATLQATQTMGFAAIAQRQTADEQRIDRIEGRVYRGTP
jgi:hypothetical protein